MSLLKEYFYNIECDVCGCLCDDELWNTDIRQIKEIAVETGWIKLGGKDYGKNIIQSRLPYMWIRINGIHIEDFKCEYVHQYQHLLRLCGLNELANNFKVV